MDLVLHIGAHRTGSTMIERSLAASIEANPGCGVVLWNPRHLRDIEGFQSVTRYFGGDAEPLNKKAAVALDDLASRLARDVAALRDQGAKVLVMSEENFIGGMKHNLTRGVFYPNVDQRLACFDSVLPMSPTRIAMGVRDYGAVWTSAYYYLPQSGHEPPSINTARGQLLDYNRGWPQVVDGATQVWPDAPILIWKQEVLDDVVRDVCARISGLRPDQIVVPKGKVNAREDATAQPPLFTPDELKILTDRYNRDVRRLRNEGAVDLIRPQAA